MTEPRVHLAAAFGLRWQSDLPLDHFAPLEQGDPDVRVSRVAALAERGSLASVRRGHIYADGTRFPWEEEAVFDTYAGSRVDYLPGPAWKGVLPHAFYGTVAAQVLAWRGLIPLHACAVEIGGRAVLIAGPGGAGKSSLMSGLLETGAALVSDDLTAIDMRDDAANALPGRTTIRLGEAVAQWTGGMRIAPPSPATRGKYVIRPVTRTSAAGLPIAALLDLGQDAVLPPAARAQAFARHLFRPAWLAALPGHPARLQALLRLAARVPVIGFPAIEAQGQAAHVARAHAALARIEALIAS